MKPGIILIPSHEEKHQEAIEMESNYIKKH